MSIGLHVVVSTAFVGCLVGLPLEAVRSQENETGWPQSEAATESIIYDVLADHATGITSIDSVSCTASVCTVQLTAPNSSELMKQYTEKLFIEFLPAIGSGWGSVMRVDPATPQYVFTLGNAQAKQPAGPPELTEDDMLGMAGMKMYATTYNEEPVYVGAFLGNDVYLERVCVSDCPTNLRPLVRFEVPDGQTCNQIGGIPEYLFVQSELGTEERRVCIPEILTRFGTIRSR